MKNFRCLLCFRNYEEDIMAIEFKTLNFIEIKICNSCQIDVVKNMKLGVILPLIKEINERVNGNGN